MTDLHLGTLEYWYKYDPNNNTKIPFLALVAAGQNPMGSWCSIDLIRNVVGSLLIENQNSTKTETFLCESKLPTGSAPIPILETFRKV